MSHIDPDVAALIALGESVAGDAERAHLAECPVCAEEVASLARTVAAGRSAGDQALLTPPPRVWDAISAELALTAEPAATESPASSAPPPAAAAHRVPRRRRPGRRFVLAIVGVAAAAVIVVAGWTAATFITPTPAIVAEARLDGFPGWQGAAGEAVLEEVDGRTRVVVSLDAAVPADGYREVWLIAADGSALVSLGILDGSSGDFPVPGDVDLDRFTLVDISQEATDGDPGHSGDSIVRGELSPA